MQRPESDNRRLTFDATHDPDVVCSGCRHRLTKSNTWSSWLCRECHDAEVWARGDYRVELIQAMRGFIAPEARRILPILVSAIVILGTAAGIVAGKRLRHG